MELKSAYLTCHDEKSKMLLLTTIDMDNYKMTTLSKIFNCTRQNLYKAKKWKASYGACGQPEKIRKTKQKMDIRKAEHFLEYLFSTGAIHDVAYGTCTLKFDNGEKQVVPHAVLTSIRNHTISSYMNFCEEMHYDALSISSLWKIKISNTLEDSM